MKQFLPSFCIFKLLVVLLDWPIHHIEWLCHIINKKKNNKMERSHFCIQAKIVFTSNWDHCPIVDNDHLARLIWSHGAQV